MKPNEHNNPDSWRRDDVNLRRALQQRNSNLPLLPEGFADNLFEKMVSEEATVVPAATPAAPAATPTESPKRRILWPFVAALSTAALLALVFLVNQPKEDTREAMANEAYEAHEPYKPYEPYEANKPYKPNEANEPHKPNKPQSPASPASPSAEPSVNSVDPSPVDSPSSPPVPASPVLSPVDLDHLDQLIADAEKEGSKAHRIKEDRDAREEHKPSRQLLALAVNVGTAGGMNTVHNEAAIGSKSMEFSNGNPDSNTPTKSAYYYFPAGNGYTYDTSLRASTYWAVAEQYARLSQPVDDSHHHMPVTIGVNIGIPLNRRFTLESGLTYTRLVSTFDYGTLASYLHSRQQVHYLGIPLRAQALIFNRRHWNIYASLGGSIELPVGTLVTHSIISNGDSKSLPVTHPTAPMQFAVGGGLGVQYSITRHLGIYAEPQLQWFIPTDSEITTYRTEHPLRFVPTFGIRWSL